MPCLPSPGRYDASPCTFPSRTSCPSFHTLSDLRTPDIGAYALRISSHRPYKTVLLDANFFSRIRFCNSPVTVFLFFKESISLFFKRAMIKKIHAWIKKIHTCLKKNEKFKNKEKHDIRHAETMNNLSSF
jgi:hypothetical protein